MESRLEQISVRRANSNDQSKILELLEKSREEINPGLNWSENEIRESFENPGSKKVIMIAEDGGAPIGFAAAEVNGKIYGSPKKDDTLYFAFNFLLSQYRGNDIADKLSSLIINHAKALNLRKIVGEPVSIAGKKHAEKTGFKLIKSDVYLGEEPAKILKGKDGINTFIYYAKEIPVVVPDYLAVMYL